MKCEKYDHKRIEKKWQDRWEEAGVYPCLQRQQQSRSTTRWWNFRIRLVRGCTWVIRARTRLWTLWRAKRRMQGYNVLYPDRLGRVSACPLKITPSKTMCILPR